MEITVHARGFALTTAIETHLQRQLRFALDHLDDRVRRVFVRLSDINGRRGGIDKRCQVQVKLAGSSDVVIEDVQMDLYLAVSRAVERAAGAVTRRLGRVRQMQRARIPGTPAITSREILRLPSRDAECSA
ncbi:MAG TPA: HPF/RaiA family ribosome-associated protein [Xanthomonadales bacterium]|nr:HPF/RaiA family ribosome-associated protein [Xanthomonadales bacterium]